MNPFTKIKSLFRSNQVPMVPRRQLPTRGRSSVTEADDISANFDLFGVLTPLVPLELGDKLHTLSILHQDVSKAVSNVIAIVNSGHTVNVQAASKSIIDAAMNRVNQKVKTLAPFTTGMDGLVNMLARQIFIRGAHSGEDVLQSDFRGVDYLDLVPVNQIRFKRDKGRFAPHQQPRFFTGSRDLNLIPLNDFTYRYYTLIPDELTPYPIPPMSAVLLPINLESKIWKSLDKALEKLRFYGLNLFKIPAPQDIRDIDNPEKQKEEYAKYMRDFVDLMCEEIEEGVAGVTPEIEYDHFDNRLDLRGAKELIDANERRIYAGAVSDPGLHGSHASRTETFLTVVYKVFLHFAESCRQIIQRRLERTLWLDLTLGGINIDDVSLQFKPDSKLKPEKDAAAEKLNIDNVIKLLDRGVISHERAAAKLGETEFHDPELHRKTLKAAEKTFEWNPKKGKYEIVRELYDLDFKESDEEKRAKTAQKKLLTNVEKYLSAVLPYFDDLKVDVIEYAQEYVKENIEAISQNPGLLREAVIDFIRDHMDYQDIKNKDSFLKQVKAVTVDAGKDFLENDLSALGGKKPKVKLQFGEGDRKAMEFYASLDTFFFSKFIDNDGCGAKIDEFMNSFLKRGEALYGQWTKSLDMEFQRLFGNALDTDFQHQIDRIINTGMANIRNRSHVKQLDAAGFRNGRINGVLEPCKICKPMHGRKVPIADLRDHIKKFESAATPEAALEIIKAATIGDEETAKKPIKELTKTGQACPAYHTGCKCFIEGDFSKGEK